MSLARAGALLRELRSEWKIPSSWIAEAFKQFARTGSQLDTGQLRELAKIALNDYKEKSFYAISAEGLMGVTANATEDEIRAAYLRKIREHPPETSPEEFERIRDAWETLRDPRRRAKSMLLVDPAAPMTLLLEGREAGRTFTGPAPWLAALKELSKRR